MEGVTYVATKAEALALAKRDREAGETYLSVVKHLVSPSFPDRRSLYCALLNGESWQKSQEDVEL